MVATEKLRIHGTCYDNGPCLYAFSGGRRWRCQRVAKRHVWAICFVGSATQGPELQRVYLQRARAPEAVSYISITNGSSGF